MNFGRQLSTEHVNHVRALLGFLGSNQIRSSAGLGENCRAPSRKTGSRKPSPTSLCMSHEIPDASIGILGYLCLVSDAEIQPDLKLRN